MPSMLDAMNWAMEHADDDESGTDLNERMRVRYKADFDGFLVLYAKLKPAQKEAEGEGEGTDDKGAMRDSDFRQAHSHLTILGPVAFLEIMGKKKDSPR